ncbi:MAG TPA: serine/threonine-protein kinase [Holophaga sp.]|nr:serine/threonine-protein kinase [Holophaga sp.]
MTQLQAKPEWIELGRKAGRYILGPRLGQGGMGEVVEAWDTVLGRTVALKVLTHMEPAAMVRFMHEAQLQARLQHPNICSIYDIEVHQGVPRIAMQLVRGPDLETASPDLEMAEILRICAQVAGALHHAHVHGLVHRDVKPGNVLLQWVDGAWQPVIVDFGLAMAVNESSLTLPNALTGTPAYMAPEQVRGDRGLVGPHSDVYGLGGTLYFLLTGRPPCVSTVTREVLRVKKERRFPSPRSLEPSIPPELEAVLMRCLAPAPGDRYPSMVDLQKDLLALLEPRGTGVRAGRGSGWRWGLALVLPVLALAGLGVLGTRWMRQRARWQHAVHRAEAEAAGLMETWNRAQAMPVHDLRQEFRIFEEQDRGAESQFGVPGQADQAPARLVEGVARLCRRDLGPAGRSLAAAWEGGIRTPTVAYLLGIAHWLQWMEDAEAAAFRGAPPDPQARERARSWFHRAGAVRDDRKALFQAALALMDGQWDESVRIARAGWAAYPFRATTVWVGCEALMAQGRANWEAGKSAEAARRFLEAQAWAEEALRRAPSDADLHHVRLSAARALATQALAQGRIPPKDLERLSAFAEEALILDPTRPRAQADWLQVQALEARARAAQGRDPGPVLQKALAFYWSRTREPRRASLQGAHMVLYLLAAEQEAARGRAPDAFLQEAWKNPGHVKEGPMDHLERLQAFGKNGPAPGRKAANPGGTGLAGRQGRPILGAG